MVKLPAWMRDEKQAVALSSVAAAVFLTGLKLYASWATNSLGIMSEALHSALDLIAAVITFVAVRTASQPADENHAYGHGKMESFSALIETMLLVLTCIWIGYEAIMRAFFRDSLVEPGWLGFAVMGVAIVVDISRASALSKIAKKHGSQALEADALHFSSDILSSAVVIVGLLLVHFGFPIGDPIAALGVAGLVLFLSYRLGRKTFDSLVDARIPQDEEKVVREVISAHKGEFVEYHKLRSRQAGAERHIDLHLVVGKDTHVQDAHDLCETMEREIRGRLRNTQILIHIEPCQGACVECGRKASCAEKGDQGTAR